MELHQGGGQYNSEAWECGKHSSCLVLGSFRVPTKVILVMAVVARKKSLFGKIACLQTKCGIHFLIDTLNCRKSCTCLGMATLPTSLKCSVFRKNS